MTKRKALIATLSIGKPRQVKQLQAYYYQDGKWRKVKKVKGTF